MKKLSLLAGLLVAGTLLAGVVVPPVIPMLVNFSLTVQAQGLASEPTGNTYKSTIVSVKVITKDILDLLEVAYTNDFTDCTLIVDLSTGPTGGDFMVLDPAGNVLVNASLDGFLSNFFDTESDFIYKGTESTSSDSFTDVFLNEIDFQDAVHTNDFFFFGTEQYVSSLSHTTGKYKDSFKLPGSGSGRVLTLPAGGGGSIPFFLLGGTVSGKASGVQ